MVAHGAWDDDDGVAHILSCDDEDVEPEPEPEPEWVHIDEMAVIAPANRYIYALAFGKLESQGYKPFEVRINPLDFADLRVWDPPFDEQECEEVEGVRGSLWGMTIVTTTLEAPVGTVAITGRDRDGNVRGVVLIRITR